MQDSNELEAAKPQETGSSVLPIGSMRKEPGDAVCGMLVGEPPKDDQGVGTLDIIEACLA